MRQGWRDLEIFLPSRLSRTEVIDEVRACVIATATDGGDFVSSIRIIGMQAHSEGWALWRASYLPGPPGLAGICALEGA